MVLIHPITQGINDLKIASFPFKPVHESNWFNIIFLGYTNKYKYIVQIGLVTIPIFYILLHANWIQIKYK